MFLYIINIGASQINKTIYLIQGEEFKVNLDSIFKEEKENTYSFQSDNKGFTLDTSSLKLISDQGGYSISNNYSNNEEPTKILRERQLINLDDYQGLGQFGILDQYDQGHRICYNSDTLITLDQCIELDNTATSYDFVFIDRNTIAVSKVRVIDQLFGVTIYQNKEIVSELYFLPSKYYAQKKQTIIEYCIFDEKKYLLIGVKEEDSNIEFLEIQNSLEIVNTNNFIDKSYQNKSLLSDIKGASNKVYVISNLDNQATIISFIFETFWVKKDYYLIEEFRGFELGYSFSKNHVAETQLVCQQNSFNITSNQGASMFRNISIQIMPSAQVKYTLNYLIVLQGNLIFVSQFQRLAWRTNIFEGTALKIDVDFQNDVLIVFTDTKIVTYYFYLKKETLSYSSNTTTKSLDQVTIKAVAGEYEQIANINFQVLAKDDYNLYFLSDTKDLYYNLGYLSNKYSIPLNCVSGPAIKVDLEVDDSIQFISQDLVQNEIRHQEQTKKHVILEQLITKYPSTILLRQFDDFSFLIYEQDLYKNNFQFQKPARVFELQNQRVTFQNDQEKFGEENIKYALMNSDGLQINILNYNGVRWILKASPDQFVDMTLGTDMLFIYTKNYFIQFYYFPQKEIVCILNLTEYGLPRGEKIKKLWVNQAKTNLIVFTFGEDLIIGRFTAQFIFISRITIKWVVDVAIIDDNKFIVLQTDKTTKNLTQYILEEGKVRIQRQLDTYGYNITVDNIILDHIQGQIIIQAIKGSQKAILIYGDTELARDSLLKVIKIADDEFAVNVIYVKDQSCLFKRSNDVKKNSSIIMGINEAFKVFEINLTKIPNQFIQQLELKYTFSNEFSKMKTTTKKNLYVEYQFQNITVKEPDQTINYSTEKSLKFLIKQDTFQGQVRTLKLYFQKYPQTQELQNFNLKTRFTNDKWLFRFTNLEQCKFVFKFERILCINKENLTYLDRNYVIVSQVSANITQKSILKELILHDNESFALIRSNLHELILINISQTEIQLSKTYQLFGSLNVSIFYKEWLLVCHQNSITYFKFQPYAEDFFLKQQEIQIVSNYIQVIQYHPLTNQIFYSTGDQNLYYFEQPLEGATINIKQDKYFFNLPQLLESLKIYQVDPIIQFFKIITQQQNSYVLVATSYGNIWNVTLGSPTQNSQINNMYIVNGPYQQVYDIQVIDDYMLVENYKSQLIFEDFIGQYQTLQCLYKNTHDWSLKKPYLPLEVISAYKQVGLIKNGSKIVLIYVQSSCLCQIDIDDEVTITINDLQKFPFGDLQVVAKNGYGQALVNYKISKQSQNIWVVGIIIFAIFIIFILYRIIRCFQFNLIRRPVVLLIDQDDDQDDQKNELELQNK